MDPKSEAPFEVIFKASNGDLIALYNNDGKIKSAREKFQNVTLPMSIRKQVFASNGEWTMDRNQFFSVYREDKLVKKRYKVFLSNGEKRKKVIIDLI